MNRKRAGSRRAVSSAAREELVAQLKYIRALVRETGELFILRHEGEIEHIVGSLESLPDGKLRTLGQQLHGELHKLKVKPEKGRLKDLKLLNKLIQDLTIRVNSS